MLKISFVKIKNPSTKCVGSGSGGRTRTYDLMINSHPLYQLSYAGILSKKGKVKSKIISLNMKND
jgi:hypothetical protein